jgi:hypothetical protein
MHGLGFYVPAFNLGFYSDIPSEAKSKIIFYYEAFTVLLSFRWLLDFIDRPARVAIYTDNMNTRDIYSSLRANKYLTAVYGRSLPTAFSVLFSIFYLSKFVRAPAPSILDGIPLNLRSELY